MFISTVKLILPQLPKTIRDISPVKIFCLYFKNLKIIKDCNRSNMWGECSNLLTDTLRKSSLRNFLL